MAKEEYSEKYIEKEYQGESSLGKRAVVGGVWVFALKIVGRALELIRTIILARLLSPNDFGLMGVAMLTIGMLDAFSRTGIESALVQRKNSIEECLDTAWTMLVVRSLIIFAVLYFGAPAAAHFFNSPRALYIIRVLALIALFRGAKNIGTVYFPKELRFDKGFVLDLSGLIVNICVSIIFAFKLRNVWALVYGSLSGVFTIFVMSYVLQSYRPKLRFKREKAKELLDFGKWLFGSSILVFIVTQGDDAFVGKFLGIMALGFYQMAYRLSSAPTTEITHVLSRVAFPLYSKMQDNIPRLRDAYLNILQLTTFLSFPMAGLIFVLAPDFTRIFLGEKWMPMVPAMRILTIYGAIRSIGATTSPVFQAIGKPHILTKIHFVKLLLLIIMIYPFTKYYGIKGTALAITLNAIIVNPFAGFLVIRNIKAKVSEFIKPLMIFAVSTFTASFFIWFLKSCIFIYYIDIIRFLILVIVGAVSYFLLTWAMCKFLRHEVPVKRLINSLSGRG